MYRHSVIPQVSARATLAALFTSLPTVLRRSYSIRVQKCHLRVTRDIFVGDDVIPVASSSESAGGFGGKR